MKILLKEIEEKCILLKEKYINQDMSNPYILKEFINELSLLNSYCLSKIKTIKNDTNFNKKYNDLINKYFSDLIS